MPTMGRHRVVVIAAAFVWTLASAALGQTLPSDVDSALRGPAVQRRTTLGTLPGSDALFAPSPGEMGNLLGGKPGFTTPRVPAEITRPAPSHRTMTPGAIVPPAALPRAEAPVYGSLAFPGTPEPAEPANGISLDDALTRLIHQNLELRTQFIEIPQADADILTASLRGNPLFYADVQDVPYGSFSPRRPGGQTQYDVSITQPLDLSGKRRARMAVAGRAKQVLEAQYQDAVRLQIDNLYTAFVDVLSARETMRYSQASVDGLNQVLKVTHAQFEQGRKNETDVKLISVQLEGAEIGLRDAGGMLATAKRTLARLLDVPRAEAQSLNLIGSIRQTAPAPPPLSHLTSLALEGRPDIVAQRLGMSRALADVDLAKANRYSDVYLLYAPYVFQNNGPLGFKSSHSWSVGITVPTPIFNRNQGNIQRARLNVTQMKMTIELVERQIVADVETAEQEYRLSLAAVTQMERTLLPEAREALDNRYQLYRIGEQDVVTYLEARRDYNDLVRQYRDSLVRHRRSMLDLNTAVGTRIMP
jgi:cobalt-zinc-cadmium efflux system outer membrane protein